MRHLFPREALPHSEANRDGGVEMATGCRSTCYDGEGNTNGKSPTDLKDPAKGRDANGGFEVQGECCNGCDTGETGEARCQLLISQRTVDPFLHVEEHARRLGHAFSQDARSLVLEIKLSLGDRFCGHNMPGHVLLNSFGCTKLHYMVINKLEINGATKMTYSHGSATDAFDHRPPSCTADIFNYSTDCMIEIQEPRRKKPRRNKTKREKRMQLEILRERW